MIAMLPAAVINGDELFEHGGEALTHHSPRRRADALWRVPIACEQLVCQAVEIAAAAWPVWFDTRIEARLGVLQRLADRLRNDRDDVAQQIAIEVGKPIRDAQAEIDFACRLIESAVSWSSKPYGCAGDGWYIRTPPQGVIAMISPFNNPLAVPIGKIAPALIYGNAVVWKPAPAGSAVAHRVVRMLHEAGCPPGLVSLVLGDRTTATILMDNSRVDAVTLTGSSLAGDAAQAVCGRRRVPLQAELGGNNAAVVWPDADLAAAAAAIALGAFASAGQRCTANRRVIVHTDCEAAFMDRLERETGMLVCGDPLNPDTQVGPLISDSALERVSAAVQRAQRNGTDVRVPDTCAASIGELADTGCYYPPTIVRCDDPTAEIVLGETFGPVLVVQPAADWEHALTLCNGVSQGLLAAIFTADRSRASQFTDRARCGMVKINQSTAGVSADAPFGGSKASGIGPAEHGPADRLFYTRAVTVYDNY